METRSRFQELLDNYINQSRKTRYMRNKYLSLSPDIDDQDDDYCNTQRRRKSKIHASEQLKLINANIRRGMTLDCMDDHDLMDNADENRALVAWDNYMSQKRHLNDARNELARYVQLSLRYSDTYWIDIGGDYTHFYFGGKNGSDGDDGHGHYIVENSNGLHGYMRDPYCQHGVHNVVRWWSN